MPAQKASIAVPPSSFAMIGSATESEVASKATISVTTESETNARISLHPGLNSLLLELLSECSEGGLDGVGLSEASIFSIEEVPDSGIGVWKTNGALKDQLECCRDESKNLGYYCN